MRIIQNFPTVTIIWNNFFLIKKTVPTLILRLKCYYKLFRCDTLTSRSNGGKRPEYLEIRLIITEKWISLRQNVLTVGYFRLTILEVKITILVVD